MPQYSGLRKQTFPGFWIPDYPLRGEFSGVAFVRNVICLFELCLPFLISFTFITLLIRFAFVFQ